MAMGSSPVAPLTDAVIFAMAELVDDAQAGGRRDPSHSDLKFLIERAGLVGGDPNSQGQTVGKAKRIRATLSWALEHRPDSGSELIRRMLDQLRGLGGFRQDSPNFVGKQQIQSAVAAFKAEGYELEEDGQFRPQLLDNLSGQPFTEALQRYIQRARRGVGDAALVTSTGKDLLEAVAAHILEERFGAYSTSDNFPTLLGQVFVALELTTPQNKPEPGEAPHKGVERATYELACAINRLRNKQGTGHGRPWLPEVSDAEAKMAVESMGVIAERLWLLHHGIR